MIQNVEFRILLCFFGQDSRRFVEICNAVQLPTDLGGYYIRQLVQGEFLVKSSRGTYTLTYKGKQQLVASYGKDPFVSRSRLCTMIIVQQGGKYVALERARQPFIGIVEWPAGAVVHGENIPAATKRILLARLGITGTPTFVGFFRRIDQYKDTVFDDKLFAVHTLTIPADAVLQDAGLTGKNKLCSREQLLELESPSRSLMDIFTFAMSGTQGIEEHTYQLSPEDLFLD